MTGCLHGPQNEENLNGTLPAILSGGLGLNFNSDLQLPHRFLILAETHDATICDEKCWEGADSKDIVLAAQRAQNAQAGYAADYGAKRLASSFNEVKECKKGHHALNEKVKQRSASYVGHRHITRLLSDLYGKGIVRSAQESVNLRAHGDTRDVTAAESMKTSKTAMVPGFDVVRLVERECGITSERSGPGRCHLERDGRRAKRPRVVSKNPAVLYAMRPLGSEWALELKYLSVCEFSGTGGSKCFGF